MASCASDCCASVTSAARAHLGALLVAPLVILQDMACLVLWLELDLNEGLSQMWKKRFLGSGDFIELNEWDAKRALKVVG